MAADRLVRGPVHREDEDFCQNMFLPSWPGNEPGQVCFAEEASLFA